MLMRAHNIFIFVLPTMQLEFGAIPGSFPLRKFPHDVGHFTTNFIGLSISVIPTSKQLFFDDVFGSTMLTLSRRPHNGRIDNGLCYAQEIGGTR